MKKLLFTLNLLLLSYTAINAQVGIGTTTPVTDLDIESRTPLAIGEHNGVLIPRVTTIPAVIAPAGTLIYVTGGATPGFYFSNGTAYVNVTDTLSGTGPFFESGTTTAASNNTQNIFRTGQTSLGEDLAGPQLYVGSTAVIGSPRTTVGVRNLNTSGANLNTYSIDLNNLSSTTGTKYGIRNNVSSGGIGEHIGIENTVFDSGFASTSVTGIYSDVGATAGTSNVNYGIRSEIGSAASRGTNYAIYAYSQHGTTTSDPSYSGYFRGDQFAIRSEDDTDGYEMPTVDGTASQVLTTDGSGVASWETPNSVSNIYDYATTGIATGTYAIPDNLRTLRVLNAVSAITLPDPSAYMGRIITITSRSGNSLKILNVPGGSTIFDDVTGSAITTINGGERFTIHSDGNDWIVIAR